MVLSFQPHSVSQDGDGRLGPMVPDGDFEQFEEEPPVAMTDSKGWSYELPKTEESSRHMELTDGDEGEEEKLVQENRLRLARGEQEEKVSPELGKGEMIDPVKCEEKEQESLFAIRYIIGDIYPCDIYPCDIYPWRHLPMGDIYPWHLPDMMLDLPDIW